MTILVTGSTGTIGRQVLTSLQGRGVDVRALTRSPDTADLPEGVTAVRGDLGDIESLRSALDGISTLFLLAPNVPDELTQAMLAIAVARERNVKGIVYLSVFKSEDYSDLPHFASKATVERMIRALHLSATVLRPAYFIQNDLRQKDALLNAGLYAMPIGSKGISMVDIRDIGEAAALELVRRERAEKALPYESYDLVGPEVLTGEDIVSIWTQALNRPIHYGGDDLEAMEKQMKAMMPGWYALDLKLMFAGYQRIGAVGDQGAVERLTTLLGHAPRSYRDFARDAAAQWG